MPLFFSGKLKKRKPQYPEIIIFLLLILLFRNFSCDQLGGFSVGLTRGHSCECSNMEA